VLLKTKQIMKNLLLSIVILITTFSCQTKNEIQVSGELIGGHLDTLLFKHLKMDTTFEIPVDENGLFHHSFQSKSGYFYVISKSDMVQPGINVYLIDIST
jgi:hypothetical protein